MKKFCFLFAITLLPFALISSASQELDALMYQRLITIDGAAFNYSPNFQELYQQMLVEDDGSIVVSGLAQSSASIFSGWKKIYLLKMRPDGSVDWLRLMSIEAYDSPHALAKMTNGDYMIAGENSAHSSGAQPLTSFLVRITPTGTVRWARSFNRYSEFDRWEAGHAITPTNDNGCIVGGRGIWMKVDSTGNAEWQRNTFSFKVESILPTSDNGYYLTGGIISGSSDVPLAKVDATGRTEWTKRIGAIQGENFGGATLMSNGDLMLSFWSFQGGLSLAIARIDVEGNILWAKHYTQISAIGPLTATSDGGAVATATLSSGNKYQMMLMRIDGNGNVQWAKGYGEKQSTRGHRVIQTLDNGFFVAGVSSTGGSSSDAPAPYSVQSALYFLKTDSLGNAGCDTKTLAITGTDFQADRGSGLHREEATDTLAVLFWKQISVDMEEPPFSSTDPCNISSAPVRFNNALSSLTVSPNPVQPGRKLALSFEPHINAVSDFATPLSVQLTDVAGRHFAVDPQNISLSANQRTVLINTPVLPTGLYFLTVALGQGRSSTVSFLIQ